jgi:hypothetical protein
MTTYRLTVKQKRTWRGRLIAHYGDVCFFCEQPFLVCNHNMHGMVNPLVEEHCHLNDKEYDNRIENIVRGHKMCNTRMKTDSKWKLVALTQLKENERTGMKGYDEVSQEQSMDDAESIKERDYNEEIYASTEFAKITLEYLEVNLQDNARIPYKSTKDSITMIAFKKVGHASQNAIGKKIDMYCSDEGQFYKYREGGKQWISRTNPLLTK